MQKTRVLIVEDKALIAEAIVSSIEKNDMKAVGVFDTGEEALQYIKGDAPDVVLMDIQLAGAMDGISTAMMINRDYNIPVIYLTDFEDSAIVDRAVKTRAVNYLTKPFNEAQLIRAIRMAIENHPGPEISKDHIFIKTDAGHEKIQIADIIILEANGAYCNIITEHKTYVQSISMNHVLDQLANPAFVRIHRSHVINIQKISKLEGNQVVLGKHKVDMSRTMREDLLARLKFLK